MIKEVKAVFKLTAKEINEALYDFYVRKLKSNNINAIFSADDITIDISEAFEYLLEVSLTIVEEKTID